MSAKPLTLSEVDIFFKRIKATIEQVEQTAELRRVIAKLAGGAAVPAAKAKAARVAAPAKVGKKARRKRKPGIAPQKVHEQLKSMKGPQSIGAIATVMKEPVDRVRAALMKLRSQKVAKMTGARGNATWTLV